MTYSRTPLPRPWSADAGTCAIPCLVPSLPAATELLPYLEQIDRNRWYTNFGPLLQEYESRLAQLTGGACVTLASGTAALELGIAALDLPPGARVLLPSFTFPATALAVLRCGLTPLFGDVDPDSWVVTPDIAHGVLRNCRYDLVLPVAAFGIPLDSEAWDAFSRETGIPVLVDAAAALGYQKTGKTTHVAFSLHATKPLGVGEGGGFSTADPDLAEQIRRMSNFGFREGKAGHPAATNAKLSEYAAAVGLAQLERWPELLRQRRSNWATYRTRLRALPGTRMQSCADSTPPAVMTVCLENGAVPAIPRLTAKGVETRRWYCPPLHHHPAFSRFDLAGPENRGYLPVTERLHRQSLGLPFHHFLSDEDIHTVLDVLEESIGLCKPRKAPC